MSAGFLQGIRLKADRLKEALVDAGRLEVSVDLAGEREVVLEAIEAKEVAVASVIQRIRDALSGIQRNVDRWLDYLKGLPGEVHAAEMKIYTAEVASGDSYVQAVDEGEAAYSQLKRNLEQLESKYASVHGPAEVPTSGRKSFTPGRLVRPTAMRGAYRGFGSTSRGHGSGGRRMDLNSSYGGDDSNKHEVIESGRDTLDGGHGHSGGGRGGMTPRGMVVEDCRPRVKLPKIRLPEFSGQLTEFRSFLDTFAATIDSQPFSKIEKLAYLKGLLKGDAEQAVSGYPLTEESYDVIVEVLHERFGNEELIVHMLYNELDDTPRSGNGVKETRQVYEKLERLIRMLEAFGENVDQRHIGVVYERRMPGWVVAKIHEKKGNRDDWSVRELRQVVGDAIRFKELVAFMESDKRRSDHQDTGPKRGSQRADVWNSQPEDGCRQGPGVHTLSCVYCSGGHYSDECQSVESIEDRKRRLSAERRCFMCTRQGHKISNCGGKLCRCGGWHHRSICPGIATPGAQGRGAGYFDSGRAGQEVMGSDEIKAAGVNASGCLNEDRSDNEDCCDDDYRCEVEDFWEERRVVAATKVTTCDSGREEQSAVAAVPVPAGDQEKEAGDIFLMTAEVPVSNPDSEEITTAAIFFDPGSDQTLIKESLAKRLGLKPLREARMAIDTVNAHGGRLARGFVYEAKLQCNDGTARTLEAFSVKALIRKVKRLKVSNRSEICEEEVEPEILMGVQDFWSFVKGVKSAGRGLTLVESTVGPIICGRRLTVAASVPSYKEAAFEGLSEESMAWQAEGIGVKDSPL